jgi:hypothetical protein
VKAQTGDQSKDGFVIMDKKTFILDDPTKFKRVKLEAGTPTVKRAPGPVHATIYAAKSPTFRRYAFEWVRKMKINYPTDRVESPVLVASLEAFLDFLRSHSKNTFLSIAFFGHGYPGGFIFEGTIGRGTISLDASYLTDDLADLSPLPGDATSAIKSLKHRPISNFKSEFNKKTVVYMFACHTSEQSLPQDENGAYSIGPSLASSLSTYFDLTTYSATGSIFYIPNGFGLATKLVDSRSSQFFEPFQFDVTKSGASQGNSATDFFNTFP